MGRRYDTITFLSDYGRADEYVGVECEHVVYRGAVPTQGGYRGLTQGSHPVGLPCGIEDRVHGPLVVGRQNSPFDYVHAFCVDRFWVSHYGAAVCSSKISSTSRSASGSAPRPRAGRTAL